MFSRYGGPVTKCEIKINPNGVAEWVDKGSYEQRLKDVLSSKYPNYYVVKGAKDAFYINTYKLKCECGNNDPRAFDKKLVGGMWPYPRLSEKSLYHHTKVLMKGFDKIKDELQYAQLENKNNSDIIEYIFSLIEYIKRTSTPQSIFSITGNIVPPLIDAIKGKDKTLALYVIDKLFKFLKNPKINKLFKDNFYTAILDGVEDTPYEEVAMYAMKRFIELKYWDCVEDIAASTNFYKVAKLGMETLIKNKAMNSYFAIYTQFFRLAKRYIETLAKSKKHSKWYDLLSIAVGTPFPECRVKLIMEIFIKNKKWNYVTLLVKNRDGEENLLRQWIDYEAAAMGINALIKKKKWKNIQSILEFFEWIPVEIFVNLDIKTLIKNKRKKELYLIKGSLDYDLSKGVYVLCLVQILKVIGIPPSLAQKIILISKKVICDINKTRSIVLKKLNSIDEFPTTVLEALAIIWGVAKRILEKRGYNKLIKKLMQINLAPLSEINKYYMLYKLRYEKIFN